jgi:hypothetical protein
MPQPIKTINSGLCFHPENISIRSTRPQQILFLSRHALQSQTLQLFHQFVLHSNFVQLILV